MVPRPWKEARLRLGTESNKAARSASESESASAKARTVAGYGCVRVPRSRALTASKDTRARSASSSCDREAACRNFRNLPANVAGASDPLAGTTW